MKFIKQNAMPLGAIVTFVIFLIIQSVQYGAYGQQVKHNSENIKIQCVDFKVHENENKIDFDTVIAETKELSDRVLRLSTLFEVFLKEKGYSLPD